MQRNHEAIENLKNHLRLQQNFEDSFLRDQLEEIVKKRFFEAKWSAWEQYCHIVRYQEMFVDRITDIINDRNPVYEAYQPDIDPGFVVLRGKSFSELHGVLEVSGSAILAIVKDSSTLLESRWASHSKFGKLHAREWVEFFMLHSLHHWYDVQKQVLLNRK